MELSSLINEDLIELELEAPDQLGVIERLASLLEKEGRIDSQPVFTEGVLAREGQVTTGFGNGIAIPHCKSKAVQKTSIAIGKLKNGVDWKAMDDEDVTFVIMLAVPESEAGTTHLQILSKLSGNLIDEGFRAELMNATEKEDILRLLNESVSTQT